MADVSNWQPIDTVPWGQMVLLWIHLPNAPSNSAAIIGQYTHRKPSEFWTKVPTVLLDLQPDVAMSEGAIWDGHVYRPMWATHWMHLPTPPTAQGGQQS